MAYYYITGVSSTAATAFAGGVSGVNGRGATTRVTFGGSWSVGDSYSMQLVTPSQTYQLGTGNITKVVPTTCITLSSRVHFIAGASWYGSDNNDSTGWETQSPGAFVINASNSFKASETLVSMAAYQGKMALFSNNTIQIWTINADPTQISVGQILGNIGTYCPLGPQSIGDLDVIFPSLTGFRSLRVRDSSNNAFVNDLGSPVDLMVQNDISTVGFSTLNTTCSTVEPSANRYWHYMNGKIYVLSYFPAAKIAAAWSTYLPQGKVSGTMTTFVPVKFVIYNQQVFVLANISGNYRVFNYGYSGSTVTYDNCTATITTPWLDLGTPGKTKHVVSIDYALQGSWKFQGSQDFNGINNLSGAYDNITNAEVSNSSFQFGEQSWATDGFQIQLQATSTYVGYCILASMILHYDDGSET
jgi:hypothetical protein